MTQYQSVNVKFSNSQIHKLKPETKKNNLKFKTSYQKPKMLEKLTLKMSQNIICHANDETNFRNKLSLIDRQVSIL